MPALSIQPSEICPRFDAALHPALGASVTAWGAYRRRFPRPVALPTPSPVAAAPEPRKRVCVIHNAPAIYARTKPAPVVIAEPPPPLTPSERMAAVHRPRGKITRKYVIAICGAFYDVPFALVIGRRRTADIVRARQVAMYLVKKTAGGSLPEIGRSFGGKDHTTILYARRKITAALCCDFTLRAEVEAIERVIMGEKHGGLTPLAVHV